MKKLLAALRGRHRPDVDSLSAHADGRLDARAAAALAAHLDGCDECRAHLAELRDVRAVLTAMPHVEAPRSFRLRQADVEAAQRQRAPAFGGLFGGAATFAPAVSAVAIFALVVVAGAHVATQDGGGDADSSAANGARVSGDAAMYSAGAAESFTQDAPAGTTAGDSGGEDATVPSAAGAEPPAGGEADSGDARNGSDEDEDDGELLQRFEDPAPEEQPARGAAEQVQAASAPDEDDGGIELSGFAIAEILLGVLAVAAAAIYAATRFGRRGGVR